MAEAFKKKSTGQKKRRFRFKVAAHPSAVVSAASPSNITGVSLPALNCGPAGAGAGAGTSFSDKGGGVVKNVHVQLIFWGSAWAGSTTPSATQVTEAVKNILAGPYMTYLIQYGVRRATLRGTTFVTDNEPKDSFPVAGYLGVKFDYIGAFVTDQIDNEKLPEPDEDSQIFCCVITPPNISSANPAWLGFNSKVEWDDKDLGDFDNDPIHYGWVGNDGTLDYVTTVLSHELVEACTDPGGGTGIVAVAGTPGCPPTGGCQIGDVCTGICDTVKGVKVQGYWSQRTPQDFTGKNGTCIVPKAFSLRMILVDKDLSKGVRSLMPPHVSSVRALIESVR